jgi:CBS-domain-containing membrane protein
MQNKKIRRLPVLDQDHRLGTVAIGDLAAAVDPPGSGEALRKISEPMRS